MQCVETIFIFRGSPAQEPRPELRTSQGAKRNGSAIPERDKRQRVVDAMQRVTGRAHGARDQTAKSSRANAGPTITEKKYWPNEVGPSRYSHSDSNRLSHWAATGAGLRSSDDAPPLSARIDTDADAQQQFFKSCAIAWVAM
jgi:hypothetical protein